MTGVEWVVAVSLTVALVVVVWWMAGEIRTLRTRLVVAEAKLRRLERRVRAVAPPEYME